MTPGDNELTVNPQNDPFRQEEAGELLGAHVSAPRPQAATRHAPVPLPAPHTAAPAIRPRKT